MKLVQVDCAIFLTQKTFLITRSKGYGSVDGRFWKAAVTYIASL